MSAYPKFSEVFADEGEFPSSSDQDSDDSTEEDFEECQYDEYGELIIANQKSTTTLPTAVETTSTNCATSVAVTLPTAKSAPSNATIRRRRVVVVKRGSNGKLGIRLRRFGRNVFFSFVDKTSPAAQAGIGFGDLLCEIYGINVANSTGSEIMKAISRSQAKEFNMIIQQRPYDFDIQGILTTDNELIYQTVKGTQLGTTRLIKVIGKGRVGKFQLLAVNQQFTLGLSDIELAGLFRVAGRRMKLRVMPRRLAKHLLKRQEKSHVRCLMHLSNPPSQ